MSLGQEVLKALHDKVSPEVAKVLDELHTAVFGKPKTEEESAE
jgi:hypothetical protein